ncbi:MAG: sodium:calcium antiporter, partial [Deltaproteobacteria bacterium]|nr:sodium:calcium antiporter [Deltaproteobacteria bacterium]
WALIAGLTWFKSRKAIMLEEDRRTEILFLGLATLYAFIIPLKGSLAWYDGLVLVSLYVWYINLVRKRPVQEVELDGPAQYLIRLAPLKRRLATASMFLFSAGVILADAELFSEGLIGTGKALGINEFLLVQWLAPIASEAPEFTVAIMLTLRGQAGAALGSLLSAKLNQWTLLVSMIPMVFGISAGTFSQPLPMNAFQMNEILLTAAQSLLAVGFLASMRLTPLAGFVLFILFTGQLAEPAFCDFFQALFPGLCGSTKIHLAFSITYLVLALGTIAVQPKKVVELWAGAKPKFLVGPKTQSAN